MQTNCLLQQYVLTGQNPVSSYCLKPPLRFALLFLFSYSSTMLEQAETTSRSQSAHDEPLNQYLSLHKRCRESFFLFWRIWSPLWRCLVAFTTVQFKGSLTFFFFYVQQHLETVDRLVFSFSKDHRRKADFSKTDAHYVWAVASPNNNENHHKKNKLICFLNLQVFFLYSSLQFRKVRYIIRSGVEERARGRHWGHFPFFLWGKNKATADKLTEHQAAELNGWPNHELCQSFPAFLRSMIVVVVHLGVKRGWGIKG